MKSLKSLFTGVQTLLSKMNKARKQETKDKYYQEIKEKLHAQNTTRLWKEYLQHQKQQQKQRKELQRKLNAALKRQNKLFLDAVEPSILSILKVCNK